MTLNETCPKYHDYGEWHTENDVSVRKCKNCGSTHPWTVVKSTTKANFTMTPAQAVDHLKEMAKLGYIIWDDEGIITWNVEYDFDQEFKAQ